MKAQTIEDVETALSLFQGPVAPSDIQALVDHSWITVREALVKLKRLGKAVQVSPLRWIHASKNIKCVHGNIVVNNEVLSCGCCFNLESNQ
jgi:hypothetical protein